jgi:hypothetical protein
MKCIPAFLLLFFNVGFVLAQSSNYIKGTIVQGETGRPIAHASVFISSTSKGTVSNDAGEFEILNVPEGNYDLVISCIGYETQLYAYTPGQLPLHLKIQMAPKSETLQNVVVEPFIKDGWKTWGNFFIENFIGTCTNAASCKIKNYKALHFRHSKKKNLLTVTADEPLIIENKALGYLIQYQLEAFSYDFNSNVLLYYGYTLFEALNKNGPKDWQIKNRKRAYNGSIVHFMNSLYHDRLLQEGFEVKRLIRWRNMERDRVKDIYAHQYNSKAVKDSSNYFDSVLRQPEMLEAYGKQFLTADSLLTDTTKSTRSLLFKDNLYIVFKKEKEDPKYLQFTHENRSPYFPRSVVFLPNNKPVFIEPAGNYYMPQDIMSYGYWSWSEKIANMLPLDYEKAE